MKKVCGVLWDRLKQFVAQCEAEGPNTKLLRGLVGLRSTINFSPALRACNYGLKFSPALRAGKYPLECYRSSRW